jgi:eukaryotic-like serine/threonine-protein kinase
MTDQPNREVTVLNAALELRPEERAAYLDEACAGDAALRQQIEDLLRADAAAEGFLEAPPAGLGAPRTVRLTATLREKPGDKIGHYKLLQQIGEGGCGVVYMAEQEKPVRRRVALKVIKLGMDTKQVIARFDAERQALALMDHPNIAKVLEAGATETGRPYFVMELVRGIKITDFCDENALSTQERLKLFIQVCQAIQHAHQKGIIHRDIKPSNILVTINDGVPVPKVIDFGIAKATQGRLTDQTLFTAFEQFIGTPAYMSPEQAAMTSLDIDTRSDIYSLGVLLYELLTGRTPFDQQDLLAAGLDEMRRTIREKEPPRPSTRLSTMAADALTTTAQHRGTEAPKLIHVVRGDLDWIVMKCLEKDRSRRYETANSLASDIRRHLNCEPVIARPPSRLYEFQKTVRRHKFGFAAAATLITVLAIGILVSTSEAIRATRAERGQTRLAQQAEEDRVRAETHEKIAKTQAAKAAAISDFLRQMLNSADPGAQKGSEYTVRQLLDDVASGLTNQFIDQPEVEADVRATLGEAYHGLALSDKSQAQLERALMLRRRIFGEHEEVADTLEDCAWTSFEQGQFAKAEAQAREAVEIYRKRGTIGLPVVSALRALQSTLVHEGRPVEAEALLAEAQTIARRSPDVGSSVQAGLMHDLADARVAESRFAEAEALAQEAVAMHRQARPEDDTQTAWALFVLGKALAGERKLDEAERALREALGMFRKIYPPEHYSVVWTTDYLKKVLEAKGVSAPPPVENQFPAPATAK